MSEQIERLTEAANKSTAAAEALRSEFRTSQRLRWLIATFMVVVLIVVGVGVALAYGQLEVSRGQARTSSLIADCTTPGGQCYEDGQRRTADVLTEIAARDRANAAAVAICSRDHDTVPEVVNCATALLDQLEE